MPSSSPSASVIQWTRSALAKVVSLLPASWIRFFGPVQYRWPVIGRLVSIVGRGVLASRGVIRYGVGAGLQFDATGGAPGNLFGTSEPEEQAALARLLRPGYVFYDIGANVGFFSVLGARLVGATGHVYAFEPFPASAERVRVNAALNHFTHMEAIEAAVARSSGRRKLRLGYASPTHSIMQDGDGIDVRTVAIDDLVTSQAIRPPDVAKIDVEGAEIEVLEGMELTIARHQPAMMCEVHWIGSEFLAYCDRKLRPLGYTLTPLGGGSFPDRPARFHALLIPPNRP